MARRRQTPEQIITKLREAEVGLAQGRSVAQACKTLEVTEQTYYRCRKEYDGMPIAQARRFKQVEGENARLRRLWRSRSVGRSKPDAAGDLTGHRAVCAVRRSVELDAAWPSARHVS